MESVIGSGVAFKQERISAKHCLGMAIKLWIAIVFIGQWMFAFYLLAQFVAPLMAGQLDESQYAHMIKGYVKGDYVYNALLLLHIIPVFAVSLSASFQLVPYVRKHYPRFHRLNGRFFLAFGLFGAITGLSMTWFGGARLSNLGSLGVTFNGILILIVVVLAWRTALQKQFAQHRRYAVHAFILINGVWTFRLYLMGWFMLNQGPFGNSKNIDGPADIALSFACYLLPMAIAELAFWAEKQLQPSKVWLAVVGVSVGVLVTLIGVVAATMIMWGPAVLTVF